MKFIVDHSLLIKMKLKPLALAITLIADLVLCSYSVFAQTTSVKKPDGYPPLLELNSWKWGGPFYIVFDKCNDSNDANACYGLGKSYVLAAGGYDAFKGIQEKIVSQLENIAAQEKAAVESLKYVWKMDSESLAQMQHWVVQLQSLASSINVAAQKEKTNAQWALWFLDKGCKLGNQDACIDLSIGLAYQNNGSLSSKVIDEIDQYCVKGYGNACDYLGGLYLHGEYVSKSIESAAKYFEHGCDANNPNLHSCSSIAKMYETGNGVAKDPAKAKEIHQFICKKDESLCNDSKKPKEGTDDSLLSFFN